MHKILTICGISRLTLQISKYGFLIRQFLQFEYPWSLDTWELVKTTSTLGFLQDVCVELWVWFWGIGNSFVFWLNGENKNSLDL
ncbi:hypothetical protein RCL_jg10747.t1 [Rhizophagus clarus]|uniref:Uncharacterized protein n=1 Tax=Rhizophagus clarus TaxID=94130 RepID=A0A8H3L7U1_9GLOM|nr:hypothetical protein RCL_jg10747.t1 [Rhizophagus clarus]